MLQGLWEWVQPSAPSALHFSKKWTALELITGKEELSSILVMILMTKTWLLFWKRTRPFFTRWHRQLPLQTRVHISIPVSFCFVFAFMLWCDCGAAPLDNVRTWVIWPGSIFPLAQYLKSFSTIARGVQLTQLMHKLRALDHTFRSENTDQTKHIWGHNQFQLSDTQQVRHVLASLEPEMGGDHEVQTAVQLQPMWHLSRAEISVTWNNYHGKDFFDTVTQQPVPQIVCVCCKAKNTTRFQNKDLPMDTRLGALKTYREHLVSQYSDRCAYWAIRDISANELSKTVVLTTDGADQAR